METKQVIVWRKDLRNMEGHKVRTGKVAAQLAHASLKAILDKGELDENLSIMHIPMTPEMKDWVLGRFTKVCVSVNSEEELMSVYNQAVNEGVSCSLVLDVGLTEFGGNPTFTCCAIGPAVVEDVDKITGKLSLL